MGDIPTEDDKVTVGVAPPPPPPPPPPTRREGSKGSSASTISLSESIRMSLPHRTSSKASDTNVKKSKQYPHAEPSISGVPDELLEEILKCITVKKDFLSLVSVSKRLYRTSMPYLYASFNHELYKNPRHLHQFLENIIRVPQLASYVELVDLHDQMSCDLFDSMRSWRQWASEFYQPSLSQERFDLFSQAAKELQLQRIDPVEKIARDEEAQAALMLSRATNLTELRLTLPDLNRTRLLLDILRETTDRGTALQNLRKFTGEYYNFENTVEGGFELAPVSSLFRLPKIEVVKGIACLEPEDAAFRNFDCAEGASTVTQIEFWRSSICPKAMSLMIGACAALQRFSCDWAGHTVGWSEINFPTVGRALRKQEKSLESLTLDVRKHYHVWPEQEDVLIPPLGSFVGFEKLVHIEAPAAALIGWDEGNVDGFPMLHEILPSSLETLIINQWSPRVMENLEQLSQRCAALCPRLELIQLHSELRCKRQVYSTTTLQALFADAGAETEIRIVDIDEVDHFS